MPRVVEQEGRGITLPLPVSLGPLKISPQGILSRPSHNGSVLSPLAYLLAALGREPPRENDRRALGLEHSSYFLAWDGSAIRRAPTLLSCQWLLLQAATIGWTSSLSFPECAVRHARSSQFQACFLALSPVQTPSKMTATSMGAPVGALRKRRCSNLSLIQDQNQTPWILGLATRVLQHTRTQS